MGLILQTVRRSLSIAGRGARGPRGPKGDMGGTPPFVGLFTDIPEVAVPAGIDSISTSGWRVREFGAATYTYDPAIDAAYVVAHPLSTVLSANGRGFRLNEAVIHPEMLGAYGDGVANDQAAFQAALDHMALTRTTSLVLTQPVYALWCPTRTKSVGQNAADDLDPQGVPLVVRSTMSIESGCGVSRLVFRSQGGGSRQTDYQRVGGAVWRGGGLYVIGGRTNGALNVEYFSMRSIVLDGECEPSGVHNYPADPSSGNGWDITDKGIRVQDTEVGDLIFESVTVARFRGELMYGGGTGGIRSVTTRYCLLSGTDADCYNFDTGCRLVDIGSRFEGGFQPIEAHGGPGSSFLGTTFADCKTGGNIWGGRIGAVDGSGALLAGTTYAESARDVASVMPWFDLDIRLRNTGTAATPLFIGSWVRGTIRSTDAAVNLSPGLTRQLVCVQIAIEAWLDQTDGGSAVSVSGPSNLTTAYAGSPRYVEPPADIRLSVTARRSEAAKQGGRIWTRAVEWAGIIGDDVHVELVDCEGASQPSFSGTQGTSMPLVTVRRSICNPQEYARTVYVLANQGSDNTVKPGAPLVTLYTGSAAGNYPLRFDVSGLPDGQEIELLAGGGSQPIVVANDAARGVRLRAATRTLAVGNRLRLRYSAGLGYLQEVDFEAMA